MIKRWSLRYQIEVWRCNQDDYVADVHDEYLGETMTFLGWVLDTHPAISEAGGMNAAMYMIAERERMNGLERPALSLTPLAKIELDATWLEDASRAAGLDFAWMG